MRLPERKKQYIYPLRLGQDWWGSMSTWRGKLLGRLHCAETHPTFRGATLLGGLRCVLPATVRVGFNRFRLNRVDIYYNKLEPAGTTWNQLGTKLEPSCNQAGTKVEPSWNQLEPAGTTWNQLEPSWNQTGSKLEPAGTTWNQLEPSWNQAGSKLEPAGTTWYNRPFFLYLQGIF